MPTATANTDAPAAGFSPFSAISTAKESEFSRAEAGGTGAIASRRSPPHPIDLHQGLRSSCEQSSTWHQPEHQPSATALPKAGEEPVRAQLSSAVFKRRKASEPTAKRDAGDASQPCP